MAQGDTIRGTVELVGIDHTPRGDFNFIVVGGKQYDYGKAQPPCKAGDTVEFTEEVRYNKSRVRYKTLQVTSGAISAGPGRVQSAPGFPIGPRDKQRSIIRQNSLGHAAEVVLHCGGKGQSTDVVAAEVVKIARKFEAYSAGDVDMEEATERAKDAGIIPETDKPIDLWGDMGGDVGDVKQKA